MPFIAPPPDLSVAPAIQELSAAVLAEGGAALWTLGDSGTGPRLGRTSTLTWETEAIAVESATNIDWEAMIEDQQGHLWILDVGDNEAKRAYVTFYEIDPIQARDGRAEALRRIDVTYPDGARDVEGAVVSGDRIYLFEKNYLVPLARVASVSIAPGAPNIQRAKRRGVASSIGAITDASTSPEGEVFLLTYVGVFRCSECFDPWRRTGAPVEAGYKGQAEALVALGGGVFLVGNEDGRFFTVR